MYIKQLFLALAFLISGHAHSATLNVDGSGILLGASDVDVGGDIYDVRFIDGTCIDLFSGCDEVTDFAFGNTEDASTAGNALNDQVFVDGPLGLFQSNPIAINGCGLIVSCRVSTPWSGNGISPITFAITLNEGGAPTFNTVVFTDRFVPSAEDGDVWAVWTPVSPIPVPAAVWLFGSALIGLIGFSKRRRAA